MADDTPVDLEGVHTASKRRAHSEATVREGKGTSKGSIDHMQRTQSIAITHTAGRSTNVDCNDGTGPSSLFCPSSLSGPSSLSRACGPHESGRSSACDSDALSECTTVASHRFEKTCLVSGADDAADSEIPRLCRDYATKAAAKVERSRYLDHRASQHSLLTNIDIALHESHTNPALLQLDPRGRSIEGAAVAVVPKVRPWRCLVWRSWIHPRAGFVREREARRGVCSGAQRVRGRPP